MSSDYHVLCVNHDPAIVVPDEWAHAYEAVEAVKDRRRDGPLREHQRCDLLIGRYSAALVEVCCPGGNHTAGRKRMHANEQWVDVDWLRLLYVAHRSADPLLAEAVEPLGDCWTPSRVSRLYLALGIAPDQAEARPDGTTQAAR
ncbi:hypothetical protein K1W54_04710 [Micromonospora sp. CPCC 205371]|nr:hypothetical protein [Micromonospora sp. CPCC 205371]